MSLTRALASVALLLCATPASAQTAVQRSDPYFTGGRAALQEALARRPNTGRARNVILFIGDGMGVSTVTASRIWEGQRRNVDGEANLLAFERLPHVALSKTYAADHRIPDSAATATALLTGAKVNMRTLGVSPAAKVGDCASAKGQALATLAELARAGGKSTGAVTTTRLTHATPASLYAHSAHRDWEGDGDMPAEAVKQGCVDIARQLVEAPASVRLNVAFGGGRSRFLSTGDGKRKDGRDLVAAWRAGARSAYVSDAAGLAALRPGAQDHVLGLFGADHLPFEADRATQGQGVPTLAEMTVKAIDLLSADKDGWFLMVEGGKIDHANHANNAYRAMGETAAMSDAVAAALAKVDLKDTLVVVTADHSHGLALSGYQRRDAPILGLAGDEDRPIRGADGKAYTALSYATGPGGPKGGAPREDPAHADHGSPDYLQQATVQMYSGAHSGEDVPIYAGGPWAHLFEGVVEQSYVFHAMRHAMGF